MDPRVRSDATRCGNRVCPDPNEMLLCRELRLGERSARISLKCCAAERWAAMEAPAGDECRMGGASLGTREGDASGGSGSVGETTGTARRGGEVLSGTSFSAATGGGGVTTLPAGGSVSLTYSEMSDCSVACG